MNIADKWCDLHLNQPARHHYPTTYDICVNSKLAIKWSIQWVDFFSILFLFLSEKTLDFFFDKSMHVSSYSEPIVNVSIQQAIHEFECFGFEVINLRP